MSCARRAAAVSRRWLRSPMTAMVFPRSEPLKRHRYDSAALQAHAAAQPWSGRSVRSGLLADLLDERPCAATVRALVVHDLRDESFLRVLVQGAAGAHLARELHTFRRRGGLRPLRCRRR